MPPQSSSSTLSKYVALKFSYAPQHVLVEFFGEIITTVAIGSDLRSCHVLVNGLAYDLTFRSECWHIGRVILCTKRNWCITMSYVWSTFGAVQQALQCYTRNTLLFNLHTDSVIDCWLRTRKLLIATDVKQTWTQHMLFAKQSMRSGTCDLLYHQTLPDIRARVGFSIR